MAAVMPNEENPCCPQLVDVPHHKPQPLKRRNNGSSNGVPTRGKWSKSDDTKLIRLVEQYGVGCWSEIAQRMPGRIGKQCRERWCNHLQPGIKTEPWTIEEEQLLIDAHRQYGNRWSDIARVIPGRPENHIKNYWNATLRRKDPLRPDGVASLVKQYMVAEGLDQPPASTPFARLVFEDSESSDTEGTRPRRSKRIRADATDDFPSQAADAAERKTRNVQRTSSATYNEPESWLSPQHMQTMHTVHTPHPPQAEQSPAPSLTHINSMDSTHPTRTSSLQGPLAAQSFALPSEVYNGLMELIDDADGLLVYDTPTHQQSDWQYLASNSLPSCAAAHNTVPDSWLLPSLDDGELDDLFEELTPHLRCEMPSTLPGVVQGGQQVQQQPSWAFPSFGHAWSAPQQHVQRW